MIGKVHAKKTTRLPPQAPLTNRLISLTVPQIIFILRSAAQVEIAKTTKVSELQARMIAELENYGELTMTSLVQLISNDKSQVSRALSQLLTRKMVQRESIRSPLSLTPLGKTISANLQAGARLHNKRLFKGVTASEQTFFTTAVSRLADTAGILLEKERQLDAEKEGEAMPSKSGLKLNVAAVSEEVRPEFMASHRLSALGTLLQRSSFLAFKRLRDLSNKESMVLAYIWEYGPVTGKDLSLLTGRTKSRIDRTGALLAQLDLVQRTRSMSAHDWIYDTAESDSKIYKELFAELNRREKFLIQDFSPVELKKFRALLNTVAANANSMLTESEK